LVGGGTTSDARTVELSPMPEPTVTKTPSASQAELIKMIRDAEGADTVMPADLYRREFLKDNGERLDQLEKSRKSASSADADPSGVRMLGVKWSVEGIDGRTGQVILQRSTEGGTLRISATPEEISLANACLDGDRQKCAANTAAHLINMLSPELVAQGKVVTNREIQAVAGEVGVGKGQMKITSPDAAAGYIHEATGLDLTKIQSLENAAPGLYVVVQQGTTRGDTSLVEGHVFTVRVKPNGEKVILDPSLGAGEQPFKESASYTIYKPSVGDADKVRSNFEKRLAGEKVEPEFEASKMKPPPKLLSPDELKADIEDKFGRSFGEAYIPKITAIRQELRMGRQPDGTFQPGKGGRSVSDLQAVQIAYLTDGTGLSSAQALELAKGARQVKLKIDKAIANPSATLQDKLTPLQSLDAAIIVEARKVNLDNPAEASAVWKDLQRIAEVRRTAGNEKMSAMEALSMAAKK
jgi:hypothetical protein